MEKDKEIGRLSNWLIFHAPENSAFDVHFISTELGLSKEDLVIYRNLSSEIRVSLQVNGYLTDGYSVWLTDKAKKKKEDYLDRVRIKRKSINTNKHPAEKPNEKNPIFTLSNLVSVCTIIGVIVGIIIIPRDTPWVGIDWWKNFLGI